MSRQRIKLIAGTILAALILAIGVFVWRSRDKIQPEWTMDVGGHEVDLSPDGRYVAVSGIWTRNGLDTNVINDGMAVTRIYDTTQTTSNSVARASGEHAAWSTDGNKLALLSGEWKNELVLISQRGPAEFAELTLFPRRFLQGNVPYDFDFDPENNLFQCAYLAMEWDGKPTLPRVVWHWDGSSPPESDVIDLRDEQPFSISTGKTSTHLRVAVAYASVIKILKVVTTPEGKRQFHKELNIPVPEALKIRLTPDGRYLAILLKDELQFFDLAATRSAPDWKVSGKTGEGQETWRFLSLQVMEVTRDGHRIAIRFDDRVEVRGLPGGQLLLQMPGRFWGVSLSADGGRLAVLAGRKPRVQVFRVHLP